MKKKFTRCNQKLKIYEFFVLYIKLWAVLNIVAAISHEKTLNWNMKNPLK